MTVWGQADRIIAKGSSYACHNPACVLYQRGFWVDGYERAARRKLKELNSEKIEEEQPDGTD